MNLDSLINASWPRVVGFAGAGLVLLSLTVETLYFDRTVIALGGLGMSMIGLSHSAGMRSVLGHKFHDGIPYRITGNKFVWSPLAITFALISICLFLAALIRLLMQAI